MLFWRKGLAEYHAPFKDFLPIADDKCGMERVVDRCCPFRNVRFESVAEARLAVPDEELVSQLLTSFRMHDCLATIVPRAFEGIPRTSLRRYAHQRSFQSSQSSQGSDVPTMRTPRRIDFALVPEPNGIDTQNIFAEDNTRCLLLGMKEPTQIEHPPFDSRSTLTSIPKELTSHGKFHLALLTSLIHKGAVGTTTESLPEWLVLFGLIYDVHHVRIVAYVPRRCKLDVIDCVAYIVDELPLRSGTSITSAPACELVLERLRLLLAFITLRRHVLHLSKSLFTMTDPRDDTRRTDSHPSFLGYSACDQHNSDASELLERCLGSSQHCSSEYSTCPSSVYARELDDIPDLEWEEEFSSSCRSLVSSFCSTCSTLLESTCTSDSFYSEDSKYSDSNYMEPFTVSLSQGGDESIARSNKLTETKRRDIIAWAREVIPTEHPVKDTYKMVVHQPHPRWRRVVASNQVRADRH